MPACHWLHGCPSRIHWMCTLSRSATRNLRENSPLFFPDSCLGPKVESKHTCERSRRPAPTWTPFSLVQEGQSPGLQPTLPVTQITICTTFFRHSEEPFLSSKRPASSQSLGSLGSTLLGGMKIPEEQSQMLQVLTPILKSDKTARF